MDPLVRTFPDRWREIEHLRSTNLVFAEICRDYEMLNALLPCAADDPSLPDIRASLAGLEEEIRAYLGIDRTSSTVAT